MRVVLVLALVWPLSAFQYPGQRPPMGYPPGQGPGSGGLSLPSRGRQEKTKAEQQPTIEANGVVASNDGKKLQVATADGRLLTMTVASKTSWLRAGNSMAAADFVKGTKVHVAAAEDNEGFLTAVTVEMLANAPGGDTQVQASQDLAQPTILKTPDAPDRPVLRRGKPANSDEASGDETAAPPKIAETKPATKKEGDAIDFTIDDSKTAAKHINAYDQLIERTRDWSRTFAQGLPNFLCQQNTTRYVEQSRSEGFQPVDVVTAKVLYEDGREKYSAITVGGKRTNKSMMEIGGTTSTGEFASVLGGLFDPETRTEFKFYQSATVGKTPAAIYDFKVALRNSNWTIQVGGQTLRPAYSGSIWVDKATAQVRRLEMQADNIPKDFPDDSVASAVDWEEVPLGTQKFLLPVHAENLSCQRGSSICSKNVIDFRDYHKYSGESTIEYK
ncbi:MAG TPA: hypothetical protein VH477_16420 [Bryobacteraceae bacterium]